MIETRRIRIAGTVQGVGFRPYIYRLASALALEGSVANGPAGVTVLVSGEGPRIAELLRRIPEETPLGARVDSLSVERLADPTERPSGFEILPSEDRDAADAISTSIQADVVTCRRCLAELFDPRDRRYRYPFITCAQCGPRFTIVEQQPYDRRRTSMARFELCQRCLGEYQDPRDRRFHAESIACPACGPRLQAWSARASIKGEPLPAAVAVLARGGLIALKGLGGWQLLAAADDEAAVARVRSIKARAEKPLAVMAPDLASIRREAPLTPPEAAALSSLEGPIVLLPWPEASPRVCPSVAPDLALLGLMLPTTPLHHLLARALDRWLVVTSGNRGGEPIIIDDEEARAALGSEVDLMLGHDRPIARRADDSVLRIVAGRPLLIRRARGWVARPLRVGALPSSMAAGGHLKNTLAIARDSEVIVSPHIGDLDGPGAREAHARALLDLAKRAPEAALACDLHPDYASTRHAESLGRLLVRVQHHEAHALAAWAEAGRPERALAITWDGSGLGSDGLIWGGEAFLLSPPELTRVAHLLPFPLPGGEAAIREPGRVALGLLHALGGGRFLKEKLGDGLACSRSFRPAEREVLVAMLDRRLNTPMTTSIGRLFDGVAALVGLSLRSSYEAQAALRLELAAAKEEPEAYPLPIGDTEGPAVIDWRPMLRRLLAEFEAGATPSAISARFHAGLAELTASLARRFAAPVVLLSGGCFQNKRLLEGAQTRLRAAGFEARWPLQLPLNDGGLALGQLVAAAWAKERA